MQVSVRQPSQRLATGCPDNERLVPDQKSTTTPNDSELPVTSPSYFQDLATRPRTMGSLVDSKAPAASASSQPAQSSTHESLIDLSNHSRRRLPRRGVTEMQERTSLKELAAFLRTRDPPPSNYMSLPDYNDVSSTSKSPFKIFRRPFDKKTASAQARHLQLPDSAVAAKTLEGHWHIAISIPLSAIGDHSPRTQSWDAPAAAAAAATQSGLLLDTSASTLCPELVDSKTQYPTLKDAASSNIVLGTDAVSSLKNYCRSERLLEGRYAPEPPRNTPPKVPLKDTPFVPVTALDLNRRNSTRTDHRHSGGTIYSERTLESFKGHSRGTSSVSTAPSTGPLVPLPLRNVELPIRRSSRQQTGGKAIIDPPSPGPKSTVSRERIDEEVLGSSLTSTSCYTSSSSTNAKLTEVLHSLNISDAISSIRNGPRTPAPTRALPDLPECSDDGRSQRSRSSLIISTEVLLPHGHPLKDLRESPKRNACPARQEKVKALRSRDMAALKEAKSRSETMAAIMKLPNRLPPIIVKPTTTTAPFSQIPAKNPSRQIKRPNHSGSPVSLTAIEERRPNRLSPIMTVASTHPNSVPQPPASSSSTSADSVLLTRRHGHRHRKTRSAAVATMSSTSPHRALTPPRSLTPSLASSDEETVHLPNYSRKHFACTTPSVTSSPRSACSRRRGGEIGRETGVEARERERQAQSETRDLEIRLQKLENSNEIILQTLGAVLQMGANIKELNQLLKAGSRVAGNGAGLPRIVASELEDTGRRGEDWSAGMGGLGGFSNAGRGAEKQMQMQQGEISKTKSGDELECMEPLMAELKRGSRVSQESPVVEVDEEEEEGYKLLF